MEAFPDLLALSDPFSRIAVLEQVGEEGKLLNSFEWRLGQLRFARVEESVFARINTHDEAVLAIEKSSCLVIDLAASTKNGCMKTNTTTVSRFVIAVVALRETLA